MNNNPAYLIYDSGKLLHSSAYLSAVTSFFRACSIPYEIYIGRHAKASLLIEVVKYAKTREINKILFITMEELNGLHLLWERFRIMALDRSLSITCFYFKYSNIDGWSIRSFFINMIFFLSPIDRILVSRQTSFRGFARYFLKHKLYYTPDFWLPSEVPQITQDEARKKCFQNFNIPYEKKIVSYLGLISEKKAFSDLLKLMEASKGYFRVKNLALLLAGPVEGICVEKNAETLQDLIDEGVLYYKPGYISNFDFFTVIASSEAVWCVQKNFPCSSGVFTRTCAWGSIPIVDRNTEIGELTQYLGLGYVINLCSTNLSQQFCAILDSLLSSKDSAAFHDACERYSKSCDLYSFHVSLAKALKLNPSPSLLGFP